MSITYDRVYQIPIALTPHFLSSIPLIDIIDQKTTDWTPKYAVVDNHEFAFSTRDPSRPTKEGVFSQLIPEVNMSLAPGHKPEKSARSRSWSLANNITNAVLLSFGEYQLIPSGLSKAASPRLHRAPR